MVERRHFLGLALGALGGVIATPALSRFLSANQARLADRGPYIDRAVDAFSDSLRALVTAITETIIPTTDTPGAREADVAKFIELILVEWMKPKERNGFLADLGEIDGLARSHHQRSFAECSPKERRKLLVVMEDHYGDHPWYQLGAQSAFEGEAPFLAQMKELTVVGFFMSEVGAKQVLRDRPATGQFDGDIPLGPDESSWNPPPLM